MDMNIIDTIKLRAGDFSPKQKKIANYILENYKTAAFMTSIQLAEAAGVSNPTVIRFVSMLGYDGFSKMQEHMRLYVITELSASEQAFFPWSSQSSEPSGSDKCFGAFKREIGNLTDCINKLDPDLIKRAAYMIYESETLFVCGFQASRSLADLAAFSLSKIKGRVLQLQEWNRVAYKSLDENAKNAVTLVFYLPRYPQKTQKVIEELKKRSIRIILITDNFFSPGGENADILFTLPIKFYSFMEMFASPIALINSIMDCMISIDRSAAERNLEKYDNYITENDIFCK